jgi:glycosyltransferase involved in cell wall biosynthesis
MIQGPRRILYVQFADSAAYPPIEHSAGLLADGGWEVLVLAIGTLGDLDLRFDVHPRIHMKKLGYVRRGWRQKLQYAFFCFWVLYWTWRWRPSWTYASDPLACPAVWLVRQIMNVNVVYHEHDTPNSLSSESRFMKGVFAYRSKLAKVCELCVLPEQTRINRFLETTRRTKPTYCVWNCPRVTEIPCLNSDRQQKLTAKEQELIVYYHGSITDVRLPRQLIVAASRFNGAVRMQIAGYEAPGSVGYVRELSLLAAKSCAGRIVESLGTMPLRQDILRSASRAHVGLSLMPKRSEDINMQHMVGASNKAFDYMASGLPLLVSDLPEWVATFVEPGYARACDPDDPASIEAELRWYLEHPTERRLMGRKCQDKIRQAWNYESMFANVLAKIEDGRIGRVTQ